MVSCLASFLEGLGQGHSVVVPHGRRDAQAVGNAASQAAELWAWLENDYGSKGFLVGLAHGLESIEVFLYAGGLIASDVSIV